MLVSPPNRDQIGGSRDLDEGVIDEPIDVPHETARPREGSALDRNADSVRSLVTACLILR